MRRHKPFMHRDMRAFHYGAGADRELVLAARTKKPARPHALAAEWINRLVLATERADGPTRPTRGLQKFAGFSFVSEGRIGQVAHGGPPRSKPLYAMKLIQSSA
jgi:hypothetical protein